MPHRKQSPHPFYGKTKKERREAIEKAKQKRKSLGKDLPIFLGERRRISGNVFKAVYERWKKRKKEVLSHTFVSDHSPAEQIARRLISKNIIRELSRFSISPVEKDLIERILTYKGKKQKILIGKEKYNINTNISLNTYLISLINRLGKEKTKIILERITTNSKKILAKLPKELEHTDVFYNVNVSLHNPSFYFEFMDALGPENIKKKLTEEITQIKKDLILLEKAQEIPIGLRKTLNKNKERLEKELIVFRIRQHEI